MKTMRMVLAGIQVVASALVHDAIELARNFLLRLERAIR
jgi:hypothetical protein